MAPVTSKLALGTVQFGLHYGVANASGQVQPGAAAEVLAAARAAGLDTLDTAAGYGESEAVLGKIGVGGWKIVTKLPALEASDSVDDFVVAEVRSSLQKLRLDRLHGLILHRPADLLGLHGSELAAALQRLRDSGNIKKIGYSVYGPEELGPLVQVLRPDLVQAPFNVFDQRMKATGWLARLKEMGTEVHTRSTFLQGLLLMASPARPDKFDRWRDLFGQWDAVCVAQGTSPLEMALGFVLNEADIDHVVVGVDSLAHFSQISAAAAASRPVPDLTFLATGDERLINPSLWNDL